MSKEKLKGRWIFETWYSKRTIQQIYNLLIEFDSNGETYDFNKFLKGRGYK